MNQISNNPVGALGGIISIGMFIYSLFSGNNNENSKPEDKIQLNTYERLIPVPLVYGIEKFAGNCIYLGNEKLESISYGGKGMGGSETEIWVFYADFIVAFGEGNIGGYLDYTVGNSGTNPGGSLSIEEFLGTSDQEVTTIINDNSLIPFINTAYLSFSGSIGTTNIIPTVTAIVDGICPIGDIVTYNWEKDNYPLPTNSGKLYQGFNNEEANTVHTVFSNQKNLYGIVTVGGEIRKYIPDTNSHEIVVESGIVSYGTSGILPLTFFDQDSKKTYVFVFANYEFQYPETRTGNTVKIEPRYDLFSVDEDGIFTSICLDKVIPQVPIFRSLTHMIPYAISENVLSFISPGADICAVDWDGNNDEYCEDYPNALMGMEGILYLTLGSKIFLCTCYGLIIHTETGKYKWPDNLHRLNLGAWITEPPDTEDFLVTWKQAVVLESSGYDNYYNWSINNPIRYTSGGFQFSSGEVVASTLDLDSMIINGNNLYVSGTGKANSIVCLKLDLDTGNIENTNIICLPVIDNHSAESSVSLTKLGDEICLTISGNETYYGPYGGMVILDSDIQIVEFYMSRTEIDGIHDYDGYAYHGLLYGGFQYKGVYYFTYLMQKSLTTGTFYVYTFSNPSLGFGGEFLINGSPIFSVDVEMTDKPYCNQRSGPFGHLIFLHDTFYFSVGYPYEANFKYDIYRLFKSGTVVKEQTVLVNNSSNQEYQFEGTYDIALFINELTTQLGIYLTHYFVKDYIPAITTPISIVYDFLTNIRYGMGISTNSIDGPCTSEGTTFYTEHQFCLELIDTYSWDYRFIYSKAFLTKEKAFDIIKDILKTCRGYLYFCDGKIKINIEKNDEEPIFYFGYHKAEIISGSTLSTEKIYCDLSSYPTNYWSGDIGTFTINNIETIFIIIGNTDTYFELADELESEVPEGTTLYITKDNMKQNTFTYSYKKERDISNVIRINFTNENDEYRTDQIEEENIVNIELTGEKRIKEIDMFGIKRFNQASRMAKFLIDYENAIRWGCNFETDIVGYLVCLGKIVGVTRETELGWIAKLFRVVSISEVEPYEAALELQEYKNVYHDFYDLQGNIRYSGDNTDKYSVPGPVRNLVLFEDRTNSKIFINVSRPSTSTKFFIGAKIYYKLSTESTWNFFETDYKMNTSFELLNEINDDSTMFYYDLDSLIGTLESEGSFFVNTEEIYYKEVDTILGYFNKCERGWNDSIKDTHIAGSICSIKRNDNFYYNYTEIEIGKTLDFKAISISSYGVMATTGPEEDIYINGYYLIPYPVGLLKIKIN